MKHSNAIAWGLIMMSFAIGGFYYNELPDPMPTHFGLDGQPDRFTPLPWGAFLLPMVSIGVFLFMKLLPAISPKEFSMDRFVGAYEKVLVAVVGMLVLVQFIVMQSATGTEFDLLPWVSVLVGVLLLVVANYMTKTEPNFFFGIRTPWTIANDEVWFRTHRHGAYLFALAGVVMILGSPFSLGFYVSIGLIVAIVVWLTVYSYILYVKMTNKAPEQR